MKKSMHSWEQYQARCIESKEADTRTNRSSKTGSELRHKNANRIVNIAMNYVTLLAYLPLLRWFCACGLVVVVGCWSVFFRTTSSARIERKGSKKPAHTKVLHSDGQIHSVWCFMVFGLVRVFMVKCNYVGGQKMRKKCTGNVDIC